MNKFRSLKNIKNRVISYSTNSSIKQCFEVKIPVPWGHVSGKWWGPIDKRPILAIHGWQDNCGTFDRLIPLLETNSGILAIDLPGHGFSDPIPIGCFYDIYQIVILIRRFQKFFKWDRVSLLGHSLGSASSFMFASAYSKEVDFLVGIDLLKPMSRDCGERMEFNAHKSIEELIKFENFMMKNKEPPSYSFDKLIEIYTNGVDQSVTSEYADYILKRNTRPSKTHPNQYYFSRDSRMKVKMRSRFLNDDIAVLAKKITCPLMNIKARDSPYFEDEKNYFKCIQVLEKSCKDLVRIEVDGTHHLHLLNPESIVQEINAFIRKHDVNDRSNVEIKQQIFC